MSQTLRVNVVDDSSSTSLRVFLHPSVLRQARLQAASSARIQISSTEGLEEFTAEVWPRSNIDIEEVDIPRSFLNNKHSSGVTAKITTGSFLKALTSQAVEVVTLCLERREDDSELESSDEQVLRALARQHLLRMNLVNEGQSWIEVLHGKQVSLRIENISGPQNEVRSTGQISRSTKVVLKVQANEQDSSDVGLIGAAKQADAYATLGGLDAQIDEIRRLVELPLRRPELFEKYGLRPPGGLLLFGPPGTGKTTLALSAARACVDPTSIETISGPELSSSLHGGTERALRKVFGRARKKAPSIVIIDEIDALAPRRDGEVEGSGEVEKRVVATLLTLMDGLNAEHGQQGRVVVIAATNRPNALDPALRRPGRLDREIEIGIPRSDDRYDILKVLLKKVPHLLTDDELNLIAGRTHGFVGADLSSLVREAGICALTRDVLAPNGSLHTKMQSLNLDDTPSGVHGVTFEDFAVAQTKVRPSAMREIALELPKVAWADIATGENGKEVQRTLRECVEWPLKHGQTMKRLGVEAPRGVLLYGPPGCSKTLVARALASESGLNFVAVKGGELINKYVGESERALREIFRKARAASPSIIFFDELDGLTTSRGAEGGGGVSDRLITTLLNEMDGIEQLANVLVVAATNRPDVLDSALLRPGRLDKLLYVGPPDEIARLQILQIRTRNMALADDVQLDLIAAMTAGCSGAEVASICQDAGLRAMNEDINAKVITHGHLEAAARNVRRRITPTMVKKYESWRDYVAFGP